jgi:hypothetical protein
MRTRGVNNGDDCDSVVLDAVYDPIRPFEKFSYVGALGLRH